MESFSGMFFRGLNKLPLTCCKSADKFDGKSRQHRWPSNSSSHEVILAIRHPDGRAVEEATISPGDILLVDAWLFNIRAITEVKRKLQSLHGCNGVHFLNRLERRPQNFLSKRVIHLTKAHAFAFVKCK